MNSLVTYMSFEWNHPLFPTHIFMQLRTNKLLLDMRPLCIQPLLRYLSHLLILWLIYKHCPAALNTGNGFPNLVHPFTTALMGKNPNAKVLSELRSADASVIALLFRHRLDWGDSSRGGRTRGSAWLRGERPWAGRVGRESFFYVTVMRTQFGMSVVRLIVLFVGDFYRVSMCVYVGCLSGPEEVLFWPLSWHITS